MSKRGIKNTSSRTTRARKKLAKDLSIHTKNDQTRRKRRINLTMSDECRNKLGELGPTKTSLGIVGQTSNNIELGVYLLHYLACGGAPASLGFSLVEFIKDVERFKGDKPAASDLTTLHNRLVQLTGAVEKVVSSQTSNNGSVALSKPK